MKWFLGGIALGVLAFFLAKRFFTAQFDKAKASVKEAVDVAIGEPKTQVVSERSTWDNVKGLAYADSGDRALSDLVDWTKGLNPFD